MRSPSGAPDPHHDPNYELGDLELAPRAARPAGRGHGRAREKPDLDEEFDEELTTVDEERSIAALQADNDFSLEGFDRSNSLSSLHDATGFQASGFDGVGDDHSLELDLPHGAQTAPRDPPPKTSVPRPSLSSSGSFAPSLSRALRPSNPVDEERVARELARYGEPNSGLGAPAYVLHVGLRMAVLHRDRRRIEQRASELAEQYERALRELGGALLNDTGVTQHEALRDLVLFVQTKQGELASAEAATQKARALEESELLVLQQKRTELEAELAPFLQAEQKAQAAATKAEAELKRSKAKVQRADIELRALTGATLPPPPERLQGIELERAQQQREIEALTAVQAEATAALGRARRELSLRRGSLDELDRAQGRKQGDLQTQGRAHEEAVAKAEHALGAALCSLAEAADAVGLAHAALAQVADVRASEKALDEVVDQLSHYDRALTVYDQAAVTRGALMWLGLFIALAILIRVW